MMVVAPLAVAIVNNVNPMFRKDCAKLLCEQIQFWHVSFFFEKEKFYIISRKVVSKWRSYDIKDYKH